MFCKNTLRRKPSQIYNPADVGSFGTIYVNPTTYHEFEQRVPNHGFNLLISRNIPDGHLELVTQDSRKMVTLDALVAFLR